MRQRFVANVRRRFAFLCFDQGPGQPSARIKELRSHGRADIGGLPLESWILCIRSCGHLGTKVVDSKPNTHLVASKLELNAQLLPLESDEIEPYDRFEQPQQGRLPRPILPEQDVEPVGEDELGARRDVAEAID